MMTGAELQQRSEQMSPPSDKDIFQELLETAGVLLWIHSRDGAAVVEYRLVAVFQPLAHVVLLQQPLLNP